MATQTGEREERRRRIAERGSDRMALITGRIQNLPPSHLNSPPPLSTYHMRHESLPVSIDGKPPPSTSSSNLHLRHESLPVTALSLDPDNPTDQGGDGHKHVAVRSLGFRLKREEFPSGNNFFFTNEVEPLTENINANEEANPALVDDEDKIKQSEGTEAQKAKIDTDTEQHTSKTPESPEETEQHALGAPNAQKAILLKLARLKPSFLSSRELYLCIIASERIRAKCALAIALLVVIIYAITDSVEVLRPLFMVLLTDVTIVLYLLLEKDKASSSEAAAEGEKVLLIEDGDNWAGAVKLLERGLVGYQAMRGLFIDCSVYVVVIVCGTCFM
ncbi:hypothetical protein L6164_004409 [Bauhinia variegata]|uniref:Uncharacterized protein n=1 Tax=Bauhinia variegata TaxID=167791 RepID=A0ACB9Q3V0_BAUVA|nr:hypothetical protein L6164_004409 [Bauhinia variegata]